MRSKSRAAAVTVETRGRRLPPEIFDLPVEKMREGYYTDEYFNQTRRVLLEGDEISPWESVMLIEGDYTGFAHLETLYLGVLARRTMIATNVKRVVEAAN